MPNCVQCGSRIPEGQGKSEMTIEEALALVPLAHITPTSWSRTWCSPTHVEGRDGNTSLETAYFVLAREVRRLQAKDRQQQERLMDAGRDICGLDTALRAAEQALSRPTSPGCHTDPPQTLLSNRVAPSGGDSGLTAEVRLGGEEIMTHEEAQQFVQEDDGRSPFWAYQEAARALDRELRRLQGMLAKCYRLTGADPDGDEDWRLAEHAVQEVREICRAWEGKA